MCLICVFTIAATAFIFPARAEDTAGKMASVYGYVLNDYMYSYGVVSTKEPGGYLESADDGRLPAGVIYADIIDFDNNESPYLVIFRADASGRTVYADIFGYDELKQSARHIAEIAKECSPGEYVTGQFCIGWNGAAKFIIYREYESGIQMRSDFYTIIDGTAFEYVSPPSHADTSAIVSMSGGRLRPEVDVSDYNLALNEFFTKLKDTAAGSVSYTDIAEQLSDAEEIRLERTLTAAARFYSLDIGDYSTFSDYKTALGSPDSDSRFYLITHMYDIGDEIYYVRFATDKSFYNYAVVRRTDETDTGYQLLLVRTDSIPLSDTELKSLKEVYSRNKLVLKKAKGSIELETDPVISLNKIDVEKPLSFPKLIPSSLTMPAALIGGGICLALLVILWIYLASDDEDKY